MVAKAERTDERQDGSSASSGVVRKHEMKRVLSTLERRWPILLAAPKFFGKRTFVEQVLARRRAGVGGDLRVARTDLALYAKTPSLPSVFSSFACDLFDTLDVEGASKRGIRDGHKLTTAIEDYLRAAPELVIVLHSIESADAFPGFELFSVVEGWAERMATQRAPWDRLALVLLANLPGPALRKATHTYSLRNLAIQELNDFDPEQVTELIEMHGVPWGKDERDEVMKQVGGHPYLLRLLLEGAKRGASARELVARASSIEGPLGAFLKPLHRVILGEEGLLHTCRALAEGGARPNPRHERILAEWGVLDPARAQVRYRALEAWLREL